MARELLAVDRVLSILGETPNRLAESTDGATPAQLRSAPEPGEWSALEILAHLRACADMWGGAIVRILTEDHPTIRAVNPTTSIESTDYRTLEFSSSLRAFSGQRQRLLAVLDPLPTEGWARGATVLGGGAPLERTVHTYADRLARHERTHWRQAAKTMTSVRAS